MEELKPFFISFLFFVSLAGSLFLIGTIIYWSLKSTFKFVKFVFQAKEYVISGKILSLSVVPEEIQGLSDENISSLVDRYFVDLIDDLNKEHTIPIANVKDYSFLESKFLEDNEIFVSFYFSKFLVIGDEKLQKFEIQTKPEPESELVIA